MSEQSAKPYLVRALYEWCVEQGYTPHVVVRVNGKTRVPAAFVKDGQIVLNIGPIATHKLTMDNEWILFNARFNGMSQEVAIPVGAVIGLYAKETGYGMGFAPAPEPELVVSSAASADPVESAGEAPAASSPSVSSPGERKRPSLTLIK